MVDKTILGGTGMSFRDGLRMSLFYGIHAKRSDFELCGMSSVLSSVNSDLMPVLKNKKMRPNNHLSNMCCPYRDVHCTYKSLIELLLLVNEE